MIQDEIPRNLRDRTGRHFCTLCLREIAVAEYLGNDFLCSTCATESEQFPLASTPEATKAIAPDPDPDEPRRSGDGD